MPDFSRQIHVVRIISPDDPDPDNPTMYLDVEVVDKLGINATNGQDLLLDFTTTDPQVIDDTGDGSQRDAGTPTRKSHMKRLTNPDDPDNFFDVEILDGFGFIGPNGQETFYETPNEDNYQTDDPGSSGPFTRIGTLMKSNDPLHKEKTLNVLTTNQISTNGAPNDDMPNRYSDVIFYLGGGGDSAYDPLGSRDKPISPNPDPNPYLKLLPDGDPWLGDKVIVKQGPLWNIRNVVWSRVTNFLVFSVWTALDDDHAVTATLHYRDVTFDAVIGPDPVNMAIGDAPLAMPISKEMVKKNKLWSYTRTNDSPYFGWPPARETIFVFNLRNLAEDGSVQGHPGNLEVTLEWTWTPITDRDPGFSSASSSILEMTAGALNFNFNTDLMAASTNDDIMHELEKAASFSMYPGSGGSGEPPGFPSQFVTIEQGRTATPEIVTLDLKTFVLSQRGNEVTDTRYGGVGGR